MDAPEVKNPEETYPGEECNCYRYTSNRVANLPPMAAITPNSEASIGSVAIEWFKGVKHVSIVTAVRKDGVEVIEANYKHCKTGERFIKFNHYSLVGFWTKKI